jgi:hypothetical protein
MQSEAWEKEVAPSFWYDNASGWDQTHSNQDWDQQTLTTSTWQDDHLPNGSDDYEKTEEVLKELLPEDNSASSNLGLMVEEDDDDNQPDEDPSAGSSEEI